MSSSQEHSGSVDVVVSTVLLRGTESLWGRVGRERGLGFSAENRSSNFRQFEEFY